MRRLLFLTLFAAAAHADSGTCPPQWSYADQNRWGESCTTAIYGGTAQSPVNLNTPKASTAGPLTFHYEPFALSVTNTGTAFQVPGSGTTNSTLTDADGASYALRQFHVHVPAEHTLNKDRSAGEIHFVHQSEGGDVAVVGVLLAVSKKANAALEPVIDLAKGVTACHASEEKGSVNPASFLPVDRSYVTYLGGLTTPPCSSQRVRWYVLTTPIHASKKQIEALKVLAGGNARDLQPMPADWKVGAYREDRSK
jgi:carbonic anhydrase